MPDQHGRYGQENADTTHHRELRVKAWVDAKLEVGAGCAGAGRIAHGLFWDAAVASEDGGGEDHVREEVGPRWDGEEVAARRGPVELEQSHAQRKVLTNSRRR